MLEPGQQRDVQLFFDELKQESIVPVVKLMTGEEMSGIKRMYNPAENIIEQNFSKFGLLSASLPPM